MKNIYAILITIFLISPSLAEESSGFYISGSVSRVANYSDSATYNPNPDSPIVTASEAEIERKFLTAEDAYNLRNIDGNWGYNFSMGYQFNNWFALEAQYHNSKKKYDSYSVYQTIVVGVDPRTGRDIYGWVAGDNKSNKKSLDIQSYFLNFIPRWQAIQSVAGYLKLGVGLVDYSYKVGGDSLISAVSFSDSNALGYNLGMGIEYNITDGNSIFVELLYTEVPSINKQSQGILTNSDGSKNEYKIKLSSITQTAVNIGYKYKF